MPSGKILHLSDLHFGQLSKMESSKRVRQSVVAKVRDLDFDVVIVTGDIANQGLPDEYTEAGEFFREVCGGKPIAFVPGNHDVARATDESALETAWHLAATDRGFKSPGFASFSPKERFESFLEFARGFPASLLTWNESLWISSGTVGDITIIGANTAFLSGRHDGDLEALAIDPEKFDAALAVKAKIVVLAAHHPLASLSEWNKKLVVQYARREQNGVDALLHGHLHAPTGESESTSLGASLTTFQSGAAYQPDKDWDRSFRLLELFPERNVIASRLFRMNENKGAFEEVKAESASGQGCVFKRWVPTAASAEPKSAPASAPSPVGTDIMPPAPLQFLKELERRGILRLDAHSNTPAQDIGAVYWPVRLRGINAVHVAQALIARGLAERGATIHLAIDDFGNVAPHRTSVLEGKIRSFFPSNVQDKLVVTCFKEQLGKVADPWGQIEKWFVWTNNQLSKVLDAAKLSDGLPFDEVLSRKPRKLLTPPSVWAVFSVLKEENPAQAWITLGGADEEAMWRDWRVALNDEAPQHFHGNIYLNEIMNLRLGENALDWTQLAHAEAALKKRQSEDPADRNRLLGWIVLSLFLLEALVARREGGTDMKGKRIERANDLGRLVDLDRGDLIHEVAQLSYNLVSNSPRVP